MTVALAFLATTATPAGGRALSLSDRAAIELACRSEFLFSPLSPGGRGAVGEGDVTRVERAKEARRASEGRSISDPRLRVGLPNSAAVSAPSSGRSGHLLPPGEKGTQTAPPLNEYRHSLAICRPGDGLAAEYATAAGCRVKFASEAAEVPAFATAWFGGGYLEHQGDEIAAQLAEQRAASLIFDVLSAARLSDGNLRIMRAARAGARDVIDVSGPAVLVVAESASRPSYVSRHRRQQAKRQVAIVPTEVPVSDWQPVRPRTKRSGGSLAAVSIDERTDAAFGMTDRQTSATNQPIVADPKVCAEHLVRYLAHHGFLQRRVVGNVADAEMFRKPEAQARVDEPSTPACASGFLKSAAARRPRLPAESAGRRLRQPRRVDSISASAHNMSDRRPRLVGQPRSKNRGPRRIPGSPASV